MKFGIILETNEPEKAWNAFRFGVKALESDHEVNLFLLGEAVECEGITHPQFDVVEQMNSFVDKGGGILSCTTCVKSRDMKGSELCPLSTMQDLVDLVAWAERVVTF